MTERTMSSAEILDQVSFVLELARGIPDPDQALVAIRNAMSRLDARDVRRVVASLAVQAVHRQPAAEVERWVETLNLEHLMMLQSAGEELPE